MLLPEALEDRARRRACLPVSRVPAALWPQDKHDGAEILLIPSESCCQTHLRTVHGGERDFQCPECQQRFSQSGNLQVLARRSVVLHIGAETSQSQAQRPRRQAVEQVSFTVQCMCWSLLAAARTTSQVNKAQSIQNGVHGPFQEV